MAKQILVSNILHPSLKKTSSLKLGAKSLIDLVQLTNIYKYV